MDRRDFLKSTMLAAAGAFALKGIPMSNASNSQTHPNASSTAHTDGMPYRMFGRTGVMLSPIGLGMLRLPLLPDGGVDEDLCIAIIRYGLDHGMNYIETSSSYLRGRCEEVAAHALRDGYREKTNLAAFFPTWRMEKPDDFWPLLDERLSALQTNVIDFCLMDTITFTSTPGPVMRKQLFNCIDKAKADGRIRYVGFSSHISLPIFTREIDADPGWDFCQIQLNYLDTEYEAGLVGLKYASDKGLGVSIVEPLRAGYLADVPPEAETLFRQADPERSPVEWAFDYLWNMPEVGIALSGMNTMQQIIDNAEYAKRSAVGMLDTDEKAVIARVVRQFREYGTIPCTGCQYCHTACQQDIAIAQNIAIYNQYKVRGDKYAWRYHALNGAYGEKAEACTGCGQCSSRCPVGIDIPSVMDTIRRTFGK